MKLQKLRVSKAAAKRISTMEKVFRSVKPRWLRRKGVVNVGFGRKQVAGQFQDVWSIIVYVAQKLPDKKLNPNQRFPKEIRGVPIDVQEVEYKQGRLCIGGPNDSPVTEMRGGGCIEVKSQKGKWGTFGLVVYHKTEGDVGLTCAHVAYRFKNGQLLPAPTGEVVYQPQQSKPHNIIGTPGDHAWAGRVDAALVIDNGAILWNRGEILGFQGQTVVKFWDGMSVIPKGTAVAKHGARTNTTEGTVNRTGVPHAFKPVGQLTNLIEIHGSDGPFADEGDSGAVVVMALTATKLMALGIVVGIDGAETYAAPMSDIISELPLKP